MYLWGEKNRDGGIFIFFFQALWEADCGAVWSLSEHDRKGIKAGDTLNLA